MHAQKPEDDRPPWQECPGWKSQAEPGSGELETDGPVSPPSNIYPQMADPAAGKKGSQATAYKADDSLPPFSATSRRGPRTRIGGSGRKDSWKPPEKKRRDMLVPPCQKNWRRQLAHQALQKKKTRHSAPLDQGRSFRPCLRSRSQLNSDPKKKTFRKRAPRT